MRRRRLAGHVRGRRWRRTSLSCSATVGIQIGVAAGIALIGAVLSSLLGNGDSFVTGATGSLLGLRRPARRLRRLELLAATRTNRSRAAQPTRR